MPCLVDQAAAFQKLAAQQMMPDLARHFLLLGRSRDGVAGLVLLLLVAVDRTGIVVGAGVTKHQAFLELGYDIGLEAKRNDGVLLRRKLHVIEAAEHGGVLVLPAAGYVEHQPFGLKGHFRDLVAVPPVGAEFVEAADDGGGHHRRTAEAGPDRKIGRNVEIETVGRLDQAYHRFDQRQFAFAAEAGEIFSFDRAAKIVRVDSGSGCRCAGATSHARTSQWSR